eukprot:150311-Chlamydomonas_euryale.AAC.1
MGMFKVALGDNMTASQERSLVKLAKKSAKKAKKANAGSAKKKEVVQPDKVSMRGQLANWIQGSQNSALRTIKLDMDTMSIRHVPLGTYMANLSKE